MLANEARWFPDDSFHIYDTTLRDGGQREEISYSVDDKLRIASLLDVLGVNFIEGGWPGAMPKDTEFFARARNELDLSTSKLAAFGATRKPNIAVEDDAQVKALLDANTDVVTLVAKSDVRHVLEALHTTLEENLSMVYDTIAYLRANNRRVFLDCEHFFNGWEHDPDYGLAVLNAGFEAGADVGILCDTNGGMLPADMERIVSYTAERTGMRLGVHCHNDTACAVANTLAGVRAGATHVQVSANGYGERSGNADLFAVAGNLQIKMGIQVFSPEALAQMGPISIQIAEIANLAPDTHQAYVGRASFSHKAGLHASALKVDESLYTHTDPELVGADTRILITEMAGRSSMQLKAQAFGLDYAHNEAALGDVLNIVKAREADGWSFEAADASLYLLLHSHIHPDREEPFVVKSWKVISTDSAATFTLNEAIVKVYVGGKTHMAVAEGNGPVNALDTALREALSAAYPQMATMRLTDYKVRIIDGRTGTGSVTRVLVTSTDGEHEWVSVGVSENIIQASWLAMLDAVRYFLHQHTVADADWCES